MSEEHAGEPCEVLPWDSEFWGFPVARVRGHTLTPDRLAVIDQWCEERAIACLYFLATFDDPTTVRCAEEGRFHLVDARVTYAIAPERFASFSSWQSTPAVAIRPAVDSDLEILRRIAGESFLETRFYFDLHFPRCKCRQLYDRWIVESCRGYADRVFVADMGGTPVGYITCHLPQGQEAGRIGLVNVAAQARRRGIGRRLILHALDWFAGVGVPQVTVVTQGRNVATQALNQRCGFVTSAQQLWYHKWIRPPAQEAL